MKIAIVILARKGSKRILNKNFKDFCNKPLIHYTLFDAVKLGYPVYFYSDCKKMREYAKKYNVDVRIKSDKYAKDKHKTNEELLEYNKEIKADILILLQPTTPLRDIELLKKWIEKFKNAFFDSGYSVYRLPKKYYYMAGIPINFDQKDRDYNGCKLEDVYFENGSFYIFRKEVLKEKHVISGQSIQFLDKYGIELDYEFQWKPAEQMYKQIRGIECKQK